MPTFDNIELLTPFGLAMCFERVDEPNMSWWICWIKETGICFWFTNQEVRLKNDWSNGQYDYLPFLLDKRRIEVLDALGKHHTYWRENINVA